MCLSLLTYGRDLGNDNPEKVNITQFALSISGYSMFDYQDEEKQNLSSKKEGSLAARFEKYKDLLTDIPLDTTGKYIQNKKRINPFDLFDKQKTTFYPRYPSHINYLQTISSDTK